MTDNKLKDRIIEQGPDGNFYSINAVTLIYEDYDGQNIYFFCPPESLYATILSNIRRMAQLEESDTPGVSEETKRLQKQMAKVIKAAVKGLLVMWGDKLLDVFYGTKDHPHVPKKYDVQKFDLVDWYMEEFAKILIANMMKKDLILTGQRTRQTHVETYISIDEVTTRPVAPAAQVVNSNGPEE